MHRCAFHDQPGPCEHCDSPADFPAFALLLLYLLLSRDQAVIWDSASRELPSPLSAPTVVGRELWFPEQPNPFPALLHSPCFGCMAASPSLLEKCQLGSAGIAPPANGHIPLQSALDPAYSAVQACFPLRICRSACRK